MARKAATESRESTGRIGQRREVVIPREIFEKLNMHEGDVVAFRRKGNGVLVKPKRVINPDDILSSADAKKVRQGLRQLKAGKTRSWADVKDELGL